MWADQLADLFLAGDRVHVTVALTPGRYAETESSGLAPVVVAG